MRIIFLTSSLKIGGSERQLIYWIEILSRYHEIYVISTFPYTKDQDFFLDRIYRKNVRVNFLDKKNLIYSVFNLLKNIYQFKPDIIQSVHNHLNFPACILGILSRSKSIAALRSDGLLEFDGQRKFRTRLGFELATGIIGNSLLAINKIESRLKVQNTYFLENYVSSPEIVIKKPDKEVIKFLYVGRLIPLKQVNKIILAVKSLSTRSKRRVVLDIVGDGIEREQLQLLSKNEESINFHGFVDPIPFYISSDVLILFSKNEGMPNAALEAFSYGLPVVSTRVGGLVDFTDESFIFFLDEKASSKDLEETLLQISEIDPNKLNKLKEEIYSYMKRKYAINNFIDKMNVIYDQILKN